MRVTNFRSMAIATRHNDNYNSASASELKIYDIIMTSTDYKAVNQRHTTSFHKSRVGKKGKVIYLIAR